MGPAPNHLPTFADVQAAAARLSDAVALAALLAGKLDGRGRVVGVVLSGGSVDPAVFARALAAG
jgi:threonine dehydratase